MKPVYVVGAGLWGGVVAERIATDLEFPVILVEQRPHIGGNCYSAIDAQSGVECHCYGSHIFHTSNDQVWTYIRRFSAFNDYRHRVLTQHQGQIYVMPINLKTINQFYRRDFSPEDAQKFLQTEVAREPIVQPRNFEEKAISLIGRPLYEAFFRGYTLKQWQCDPRELSEELINRLPLRFNNDDHYFADRYEGIPLDGYTKLFERLVAHPRIQLRLNCDFQELRPALPKEAVVCYSGRLDQYFNYCLGELAWRSVEFEVEHPATADFQGCTVMNYADETVPYTRIHEFKHYHPERPDTGRTVIYREYSHATSLQEEPFYPVNTAPNRNLVAQYQKLAAKLPNVFFGGRLGSYRYLDMDDTIAHALQAYEYDIKPYLTSGAVDRA